VRPFPRGTTVGQLDQDAGAVTHQLVGTDGAAVVQVLEDLQPMLARSRDDLTPLMLRHKADTAGVVLGGRGIQTVLLEMLDLGSRRHGGLLCFSQG
jgi:hypothetical protein